MALIKFVLYILATGISLSFILGIILRNLSWKNLGPKLGPDIGHRLIMSYYYWRCHNRHNYHNYHMRRVQFPKKHN